MIGQPQINDRPETPYMGIRTQVPVMGMSKVAEKLYKELPVWLKQHRVEAIGPSFLRYYVIDIMGEVDFEVGFPVEWVLAGDRRVSAGVLPAGSYASLVYFGSGLAANRALIEWAKANGITWQRWNDGKGDAFYSCYQTFLTDPNIEPRKTKWDIEMAIKLTDK
jgi:effector-binding domain-containing protein